MSSKSLRKLMHISSRFGSRDIRPVSSVCNSIGLDKLGIVKPNIIHHNLTYEELFIHELQNNEGVVAKTEYGDGEVFAVDTGIYTGRSPKDKWIVKNIGSISDKNLWWGDVNQPMEPDVFDELYDKSIEHYNELDKCYVFDGFCGANPNSQKKVRFIHEMAWQQHFVSNMFIRPKEISEIKEFVPDFTIINACSQVNKEWKRHGLNSDVAVAFNIEKQVAVILGTWYGGENKKGIFSLMNYWLPLEGIMTMHCSANVGKDGDTALFFGLSASGKTTLSSDPKRYLIGDDEHGWDDDGIFNFEGGCYAKTIDLKEENEPEIYRAIHKNALLENVTLDSDGWPDYSNKDKTENGRVSYPIDHINNWHEPQIAGHPKNIIFLACDAFGVLPPVAKLTSEEAKYYFLNGYTAKVAGTERGITEPIPTLSPCFGGAFLTLPPMRYADLLAKKIEEHNSDVYLVNTGWVGGKYGVGRRMSIQKTRKCIDAILNGDIANGNVDMQKDPIFGFNVPIELDGVEKEICNPRESWVDKEEYDREAQKLKKMFEDNYRQYEE